MKKYIEKKYYILFLFIAIIACRKESCPPVGFVYYENQFHQDSAKIVINTDTTNVIFEQDKLRDTKNNAAVRYFQNQNDTIIRFYFIGKTSSGSRYYRPEKYIRSMADTIEIGINHQPGLAKNGLFKQSCELPNDFYSVDTLLIFKPNSVVINFIEK